MFVTGLRLGGKLRGSVDNYWQNYLLEVTFSKVNLDRSLPKFLGGLALGMVANKVSSVQVVLIFCFGRGCCLKTRRGGDFARVVVLVPRLMFLDLTLVK